VSVQNVTALPLRSHWLRDLDRRSGVSELEVLREKVRVVPIVEDVVPRILLLEWRELKRSVDCVVLTLLRGLNSSKGRGF